MSVSDVFGLITVLLLLGGILLGVVVLVLMQKEADRRSNTLKKMIDECVSRYDYYLSEGDVAHQHDEIIKHELLQEVKERIGL